MNARPAEPGPDLTACDREPIHAPGSIQPHGILLGLTIPDLTLVHVSANARPVLGTEPAAVLRRPLGLCQSRGGTDELLGDREDLSHAEARVRHARAFIGDETDHRIRAGRQGERYPEHVAWREHAGDADTLE